MLQFCGKTNTLGTVPNVAVFKTTNRSNRWAAPICCRMRLD